MRISTDASWSGLSSDRCGFGALGTERASYLAGMVASTPNNGFGEYSGANTLLGSSCGNLFAA